MDPRGLHRRWSRNLTRLVKAADSLLVTLRRTGDAGAVHDLRVTIRRARLHLRIGAKLLSREERRRFDEWGRELNHLLGPVRDCDVAMNWVARQPDALDCLNSVQELRRSCWAAAAKHLAQGVMRSCPRPSGLPEAPHPKLAKRLKRELARERSAVHHSIARFARLTPTRRHALRRRVRRWRYLRELALPAEARCKDRLLRKLLRTQDALGELQNLRVTLILLKRVQPDENLQPWTITARRERTRLLKTAQRRLKALR